MSSISRARFTQSLRQTRQWGGLTAYKNVLDIPDSIDLAVVWAPSKFTPDVMEEVGKKEIKGAIIVSAGFKEVDEPVPSWKERSAKLPKSMASRSLVQTALE